MALKYKEYTDHQLVSLLKEGDQLAFSEIYERYWDKLFVVSVNRMGDAHEAEECVQDVLYKLWLLREDVKIDNDSLGAYLSVAVRNQVFNRRLKLHRERLRAEGFQMEDTDYRSPEMEVILRELQERIDQAINALPTQCRIVFEMSHKEGKSIKDIAVELDISENTVKYHLKKARRDINNNLDVVAWFSMIFYFFSK